MKLKFAWIFGMSLALASGPVAAAVPWLATPYGIGPLKVGMTTAEAAKAAGEAIKIGTDQDARACSEIPLIKHPGVVLMLENDHVTSLSVTKGTIMTARGIGIGATEAEVEAQYPTIEIGNADYDELPAHNLTLWTKKDVAGIRFKTNMDKKVWQIAVGGHSILYSEGCL